MTDRPLATILTIDDEAVIRQSISLFLENRGYAVLSAGDGKSGLEVFRNEKPDVVLVDLRMPEMDGLDVLDVLTKESPGIPAIVVSGTGMIADAVGALRRGAWDYLLKPIEDMAVLLHAVERALERSRLIRENQAYQQGLEEQVAKRTARLEATNRELAHEIEVREQAEAALRKSEKLLSKAEEIAHLGSWELDLRSDRLSWSAELYRLFGLDPETTSLTLEQMLDRIHPEDRNYYSHRMDLVKAEGSVEFEYRLVQPDGTIRWVWGQAETSCDEAGELARVYGTMQDITDRKRAEEEKAELQKQLHQAQKMEAIGQLAGGVAHDFNNMLTVIVGNAQFLRRKVADDEASRTSLEMIENAVQQAAGVTRSLLTFGRKLPTEKKPVNLCRLIDESTRMLRRVLPASVELVTEICAEPPIWVSADPTQLQQVLMNLAINARDAMPAGGTLRVQITPAGPHDVGQLAEAVGPTASFVRWVVSDTGTGFSPEAQSHLFEPFFTTKPRGQGTGLGLSIIHGIVKDHGGRVEVDSEPGHGATFTMVLPCIEPASAEEQGSAPADVARGSGEMILLAEDDKYVRAIMVSTLRMLGYNMLCVEDGPAAIEAYRHNRRRIRLFIFDLDLPGRSGLACLREIRADSVDTPAILVTGNVETDLAEECDHHTHLLRKPFPMAELGQWVDRLLRER